MPAAQSAGQREILCLDTKTGTQGIDRWGLLQLIKDLRKELKLLPRDITTLKAHLTVLPKGLLDVTAINFSFMEVGELLERADCMNDRTFRRSEQNLEERGLCRRKLSANGRRFAVRENGRIVSAYGLDLSPLLQRVPELMALREQAIAQRERIKSTKTRISSLLQELVRSSHEAPQSIPDVIREFVDDVRRSLKRTTLSIAELESLEARVLSRQSQEGVQAPCPTSAADSDKKNVEFTAVNCVSSQQNEQVSKSSDLRFTAVNCSENPSEKPVTPPELEVAAPDKSNGDDGQNDRHIESGRKDNQYTRALKSQFHPMRFAAHWASCQQISDFYPEPPATEHAAAKCLFDFCSFMGLRQPSITAAISAMGWTDFTTCIDYLASKLSDISKPDGYLRSMIKGYEAGQPVAGGRVRAAA